MPIISIEIMKKIDEREMQKTTNQKQTKTKRSNGDRSYSEMVRAKWFCCAFKLDFLQLICKASLIFKSNLELALSIILKQRELYESKHVSEECRCLLKVSVTYWKFKLLTESFLNFFDDKREVLLVTKFQMLIKIQLKGSIANITSKFSFGA